MLKYYTMKTEIQNKDLKYLILKLLEDKYSCAEEILQKLKGKNIDFDERKFYPSLSFLQLQNLLCTNWLTNNGQPIKYYHLTKNGFLYIHQ